MNSDWKKYHGALITNQPPHILPKSNNLDKLIKDSKSYFCRWITDFDTKKETPFWYVINDTNFSLGDLSHKTRNQIKKGRAGTREIIRNLNNGKSIAIMVDQRVREGKKVPFFETLAATTTIPAQLIKKYRLKIFINKINCRFFRRVKKKE